MKNSIVFVWLLSFSGMSIISCSKEETVLSTPNPQTPELSLSCPGGSGSAGDDEDPIILGIVKGLGGIPLAAAHVELYSGSDSLLLDEGVTDGSGETCFHAAPNDYYIIISASGYAPETVSTFIMIRDTTINVAL